MSIDNIAEKCQRLRSIPLETLDIDSKLKVIQVQVNFIFLLQLEEGASQFHIFATARGYKQNWKYTKAKLPN